MLIHHHHHYITYIVSEGYLQTLSRECHSYDSGTHIRQIEVVASLLHTILLAGHDLSQKIHIEIEI